MSAEDVAWAYWCSPTEGIERSVVTVLASYANAEHVAFSSIPQLAELTGWTVRAVQDALYQLEWPHEVLTEIKKGKRRPLTIDGKVQRVARVDDDGTDLPAVIERLDVIRGDRHPTWRLNVTLCRHRGEDPDADPRPAWAENCTHHEGRRTQETPPRRGRRAASQPPVIKRGGAGPAPMEGAGPAPTGGIEGAGPADEGAGPASEGAGPAPHRRGREEERKSNSPTSTVSPHARETPAPGALGASLDEAPLCAACRGHHRPDQAHVRPTPPPPDWRSSSLPVDDDVEIEDPPEGWEDEPLWTDSANQVHPPAEHEETSA